LRLLVVKHLYNWSFAETMRRVADSLVLRWFCRVYFRRARDATTLLRWAQTVRPTTVQALIDRVALLAKQAKVTQVRKLRVDATVVETPIHYPTDSPTDSGLLGDGVRVLTRLALRAKPVLQERLAGKPTVFRNRRRSLRRSLQALYRVVRRKAHTAVAHQRPLYERLIQIADQSVQQARTVRQALASGEDPPDQPASSIQRGRSAGCRRSRSRRSYHRRAPANGVGPLPATHRAGEPSGTLAGAGRDASPRPREARQSV
jgi:IS5 family transposase